MFPIVCLFIIVVNLVNASMTNLFIQKYLLLLFYLFQEVIRRPIRFKSYQLIGDCS